MTVPEEQFNFIPVYIPRFERRGKKTHRIGQFFVVQLAPANWVRLEKKDVHTLH
tara:strand:- start:175 stop:336 length:162 start_codon:yes stop_codon:yes gene_type:complete